MRNLRCLCCFAAIVLSENLAHAQSPAFICVPKPRPCGTTSLPPATLQEQLQTALQVCMAQLGL